MAEWAIGSIQLLIPLRVEATLVHGLATGDQADLELAVVLLTQHGIVEARGAAGVGVGVGAGVGTLKTA